MPDHSRDRHRVLNTNHERRTLFVETDLITPPPVTTSASLTVEKNAAATAIGNAVLNANHERRTKRIHLRRLAAHRDVTDLLPGGRGHRSGRGREPDRPSADRAFSSRRPDLWPALHL